MIWGGSPSPGIVKIGHRQILPSASLHDSLHMLASEEACCYALHDFIKLAGNGFLQQADDKE